MLVLKTIFEAKSHLQNERNSSKKIAFVPTMGALHDGHLALVEEARKRAEIVVVSIFVNKAQFNDLNDYEKYPRQLEDDLQKLQNRADYVFAPSSEEMFPQNFSLKIAPIELANCLCGASRPGHFEGVAKVVTRLFEIIQPDVAVFGEKDFQQLAIIKNLGLSAKIIGVKTLREASGLAMSSRNQRLSEASKIKASALFKILNEIVSEVKKSPQNVAEILQKKHQQILDEGFEKIDYLEIRDEKNLHVLAEFTPADILKNSFRIFVAAHISGVRLIDNLPL